jgi:ribosomal protein S18 acetylase RimI-like enzyme
MSSPSIRDAAPADAPVLVTLVESAYRGEGSREGWTTEADLLDGQRTDLSAVEAALRSPDTLLLVAEEGGAIIGCCQIDRKGDGLAYFGTFAVQPGLQSRGLGRSLLTAAEDRARSEWHCTRMEMQVIAQRDELIAWYLRRGYALTGATRPFPYGQERAGLPRRPDLHFVVLQKDLTG